MSFYKKLKNRIIGIYTGTTISEHTLLSISPTPLVVTAAKRCFSSGNISGALVIAGSLKSLGVGFQWGSEMTIQ